MLEKTGHNANFKKLLIRYHSVKFPIPKTEMYRVYQDGSLKFGVKVENSKRSQSQEGNCETSALQRVLCFNNFRGICRYASSLRCGRGKQLDYANICRKSQQPAQNPALNFCAYLLTTDKERKSSCSYSQTTLARISLEQNFHI